MVKILNDSLDFILVVIDYNFIKIRMIPFYS